MIPDAMRRPWLLALLLAAAPVLAADTIYRDPRRPSFSLLVPDGFELRRQDSGVMLRRGEDYFMLSLQRGDRTPAAMLVQFRPQFEKQWKDFRELGSGPIRFGGLDGVYAEYAGVPPSGNASVQRIIVVGNGQLLYIVFQGHTAATAAQTRPALERIERSVAIEPLR